MDMTTVKNITIPQGSVKKIENSNGDIIWASYDEFPYRRLEYVTTTGSSAFNSGIKGASNSGNLNKFKVKVMPLTTLPSGDPGNFVVGCYNSSSEATDSSRHFYAISLGTVMDGLQSKSVFFGGGMINSSQTNHTSVNTPILTVRSYVVESSMLYTNPYIRLDGHNFIIGTLSESVGTTDYNYGIGALYDYYNRNDSNNGFSKGFQGRIYGVQANRLSNSQTWWFVPAQRKSDGKVGFVLIKQNSSGSSVWFDSFKTSEWTNDFVAGPVTNEYFDHTVAPSMGF